jgi:hypothetical protein
MNNRKNIVKPSKSSIETTGVQKIARYEKASYFLEKDKKAVEFLKQHPLPAKFLK